MPSRPLSRVPGSEHPSALRVKKTHAKKCNKQKAEEKKTKKKTKTKMVEKENWGRIKIVNVTSQIKIKVPLEDFLD